MVVTRSQQNGSETNGNARTETKKDSQPDTSLTASERKTLIILFVSLVIDLLAFTVILPLLPTLLDYYGAKEDQWYGWLRGSVQWFRNLVGAPDTPRWNSVLFGGLIGSLFSLLQFIASPVIGAASDVYGRKPMLLLSMVGVAVSYALWAVSRNFGLFVIARIIGGISKGNISISTAIVADVLPIQRRGKGMAVIGVAFSIGFVFGPLIGAIFSVWAKAHQGEFYVMPALFALTLAVVDILFVTFAMKETLQTEQRAKSISTGWQKASNLINPISLFKFTSVEKLSAKDLQEVRKIGMVYFLYLFFYSGLEFTLTFLTHNRLQYDSMQQGKMFFFIGLIMTLVQGGYARRVARGKELKTVTQGIMVLIPSFIIMAFAKTAFWVYVSLVLFAFASATVVPCLTTIISIYGGIDQKGTIMGVFRSLGALARAFGPVFASTIYWSFGAEACYISGAVLLVIPYMMLRAGKPVSKQQ